ncbi:MAG: hypothetical protein ACP5NS_01820 [Candidatus Pacearchaeota archaeon]
MFGFKKKDEMAGLPELNPNMPSMRDYQRPQLPAFQPLNEEKDEIHGLPSFPDSPMSKGFSQTIIKSAIDDEDKNLPELPEWSPKPQEELPSQRRTIEMQEWSPSSQQIPSNSSMLEERIPRMPVMQQEQPFSRESRDNKRPIFVKIEKFKESRESLTKIAEKLDQMDELLKMIKDVKSKEDAEITEWERDIENIKARIAFINKEIFENAY